jgi:tagaturonate reductase
MRCVPSLLHYYHKLQAVPHYMALGFAAYLLFMRGTHQKDGVWYGELEGQPYPIQDDKAGYFAELWSRLEPAELAHTVLHNQTLWGHDLTALPGFTDCVSRYLHQLLEQGAPATVAQAMNRKSVAV